MRLPIKIEYSTSNISRLGHNHLYYKVLLSTQGEAVILFPSVIKWKDASVLKYNIQENKWQSDDYFFDAVFDPKEKDTKLTDFLEKEIKVFSPYQGVYLSTLKFVRDVINGKDLCEGPVIKRKKLEIKLGKI